MTLGAILDRYPVTLQFVRCVGIRYWSGRGAPSTPWSKVLEGVDCSGFWQMAAVLAGIYRASEPDRRATADNGPILSLANIAIETKVPRFGDMAVYPGHVMFVLDEELVIGASGGTSKTFGDDPKACVSLRRPDYRPDFLCFATLKPEHRLNP